MAVGGSELQESTQQLYQTSLKNVLQLLTSSSVNNSNILGAEFHVAAFSEPSVCCQSLIQREIIDTYVCGSSFVFSFCLMRKGVCVVWLSILKACQMDSTWCFKVLLQFFWGDGRMNVQLFFLFPSSSSCCVLSLSEDNWIGWKTDTITRPVLL